MYIKFVGMIRRMVSFQRYYKYLDYLVDKENYKPKWIYENYTNHIDTDEPLHIYDSSSGWGGISKEISKKIHYVGTDPNLITS